MKKFTCRKDLIFILLFVALGLAFITGSVKDSLSLISFLIYIVIVFFFSFLSGIIWMIKYDENSFTFISKGRKNIEYKDIQSVTHYQVIPPRHARGAVDKFIIKYSNTTETDSEEETKKLEIQNYPDNKTRDFFSYMKERNPNIVFSFHKANGEGVENLEFDFFSIDTSEEKTLE